MSMMPRAPTDAELAANFAPDLSDGRMSYAALRERFARGGPQLLPQQREKLETVYRHAGVHYGEPMTRAQYLAGMRGAWREWQEPRRSSLLPLGLAAAAAAFWFMSRRGR